MLRLLWYTTIAFIKVHINELLSLKLQKKLSEKRVIKGIKNAYKNIPYYRKKYDDAKIDINSINRIEDLKKLPFITKDEIRKQFPNNIISKKFDIKKCHYSATTGSTGKSLPFLFSIKTFAFYIATGIRLYTMIGFRPWHKTVYIKYTPLNYPKLGPFFKTEHIPSTISVYEQIAMLKNSKPDLLIGYASIIFEISQKVTDEDLKYIHPKFIGINSELSSEEQRDAISEVFNCPVYDEYSTEETWMIASQCKNHNYHLFIDNVFVEFLDENGNDVGPGEIGEIFLTTTQSPAMPFIRYRIGDLGSYTNKRCSCGMGFPLLETFEGRCDDSFILPSGKFISSLKILNTFTKYIKKHLHLMEEFKVIQKKKDTIIIELVKGKEYKDEYFQELINSLHVLFDEPVMINVEIVDSINSNGGIKRKAIESWVKKDILQECCISN